VEKALKAIDKTIRKPKEWGSRPFRGYYNNCGHYGHRQLECTKDLEDLGLDSTKSTKRSLLGQEE
jgi:hypothetical protein